MRGRFPILYLAEADAEAAVMSSGVLSYLADSMPQNPITIIGSSASAPLFADTPRLARLLVLEKETTLHWWRLWNEVRETKWGLVVDMRGSGLWKRLKREKRAVRGRTPPGLHAVEQAAHVLHLEETPAPRLPISAATQAIADALVRPNDQPILAVGPGTAWIGKRWPAERYSKLAVSLLADDGPMAGGRLMIVGGDGDRELAHAIRSAVSRDRVIEAHGRLTPLQTAAALKHASLYVGADSLWTQLAVAAGAPVIGVYGPSDEAVVGPWGGVSVRGPRSLEEFQTLDPRLNQALEHMLDLPADRVLKAARKMLAERAATP